jgi:outer membrane murein-binding lipoprotein Lpp
MNTTRPVAPGSTPLISTAFALALGSAFLTGCASAPLRLESPACATMRAQITEKQKLDATVKALAKEARAYRTKGDTAAAGAAERRLEGLLEQQRFLKDALDNNSRDCASVVKDVEPVLDPAVREKQRLEGR